MEKYMEEKYLLIKTSILEVEEIKDNLSSKCVELTEEEILIITNIGEISGPSKEVEAYCEARKKIRKVLD